MHSRGILHAQHWLSSGGNWLLLLTSQFKDQWLHSFQVFPPAPLVSCGQETLSTAGGAATQLLAWTWATRFSGHQNTSFEDPKKADRQPLKFSGQKVTATWFCRWVSHWLVLLLRHCRNELSLPRFTCQLLRALPSFSITIGFPAVELHRTPCNPCGVKIRVAAPIKQLTMLGLLTVPLGFSFSTGGARSSGETSPYDSVLAWEWGLGGNVISV